MCFEKKVQDIVFKVSYIRSEKYHHQWQNTFEIELTNNQGKTFNRAFDFYSNIETTDFTSEMFNKLVDSIVEAWFVNSESYDSFEEWCLDFGHDEEDSEIWFQYNEDIKLGDELKNLISEEWIESMDTYLEMSRN
jgi:uncharacterized protein YccT (UPF0319 family)